MPRKVFMVGEDRPVTGPLSVATVIVAGAPGGSAATALDTHVAAAAHSTCRRTALRKAFTGLSWGKVIVRSDRPTAAGSSFVRRRVPSYVGRLHLHSSFDVMCAADTRPGGVAGISWPW